MFISDENNIIDIFLDIFSMIVEKPEKNEIDLKSENFELVVDDGELKQKKVLMKFFKILRKIERSIVQFEDQILIKFSETDLIILMTITMTTVFMSSKTISSKR